MALTSAQQATLKAYIAADPTLSAFPNNSDGAFAIAAAMNVEASPAFVVWRTSVPVEDYRKGLVWSEVNNIQAATARTWEWLTGNMTLPFDASDVNVRAGLSEVWAANSTTRPALLAVAKRNATVAEKLFATGTGSDASPATMGFEGSLSYQDVQTARNL